ncbi:MAG TPA: hypothetical protein VIX80_10540 [Candidatus Kapabacteria bacterium]
MKRITIFLICISLFAIGCAPTVGTEQVIRTINNEEIPVQLLSVRSDALIVDILELDSLEYETHRPNIVRFGFDTIDAFLHSTLSSSRTLAVATTSGVVVGIAIGREMGGPPSSWGSLYTGFAGAIIVLLVGSATTGILAATGNHTYDPHDPDHLEKIIQLAVYKNGEPDELKKIK